MALNMTVQSYAGMLEFGLTACRRTLSQDESYELIGYLKDALREIEALPTVDAPKAAEPAASPVNEPGKASAKKKSVTIGQPEASQGDAAANQASPRVE
jgi:hypothetical protein